MMMSAPPHAYVCSKLDVRRELDPLEKQQEELLAQITKASEVFEATRAKNVRANRFRGRFRFPGLNMHG